MAIDEKFAGAFVDNETRHKILGVKLRRFSVWHLFLLQVLDSPFIQKGDVTLHDLKNALSICTKHKRGCRIKRSLFPLGVGTPKGFLVRLGILISEDGLRQKIEQFIDYVGDYLSKPEYDIIPQGGSSSRSANPPPAIIALVYEAAQGANCKVAEAWDMPIGEAYVAQSMFYRRVGLLVDFMDEDLRKFREDAAAAGFKSKE